MFGAKCNINTRMQKIDATFTDMYKVCPNPDISVCPAIIDELIQNGPGFLWFYGMFAPEDIIGFIYSTLCKLHIIKYGAVVWVLRHMYR